MILINNIYPKNKNETDALSLIERSMAKVYSEKSTTLLYNIFGESLLAIQESCEKAEFGLWLIACSGLNKDPKLIEITSSIIKNSMTKITIIDKLYDQKGIKNVWFDNNDCLHISTDDMYTVVVYGLAKSNINHHSIQTTMEYKAILVDIMLNQKWFNNLITEEINF